MKGGTEMNNKMLYELCETLNKELEEVFNETSQKGMNSTYLDYIDKLTHSIKSDKAVIAMEESILALTVFKKGLPNIMGQKSSCGDPSTRKSVGYLILPHKTSTSLTIPSGAIVSLFASLIVTSISSISTGAISFMTS